MNPDDPLIRTDYEVLSRKKSPDLYQSVQIDSLQMKICLASRRHLLNEERCWFVIKESQNHFLDQFHILKDWEKLNDLKPRSNETFLGPKLLLVCDQRAREPLA